MKPRAMAGWICGAAILLSATADMARGQPARGDAGELAAIETGALSPGGTRATQFTVDAIERWAVDLKRVLDAHLCATLSGLSLIGALLVSLANASNSSRRIVFRKDEELSKPINWRPLAIRALAISSMAFALAMIECIVIDPLMSYRYVDLETGGYGGLYFGLFFCVVSVAVGIGGLLYTASLILRHDVEPPESNR